MPPAKAPATEPLTRPSRASGDASASQAKQKPRRHDSTRETIESIVVAFILAFLFRTFEAEAFVIPTGSMATTLLGRHKDVQCPQCGIRFTVGASDELDNDDQYYKPGLRLRSAACPNCRFEVPVLDLPAFKGDRILVNKFPYELSDPQRWQVAVFKYPEDAKVNYIKRVVGLPGEALKIDRGNVYARHNDADSWKILRKEDPEKQRVMQVLVYDNDHPERDLLKHGWPERWAAVRHDGAAGSIAGWSEDIAGWRALPDARSFVLNSSATKDGALRWIRYRHFVPTTDDWNAATEGNTDRFRAHRPPAQLITDFCGYNAYIGNQSRNVDPGYYWVGDLSLTFKLELRSAEPDGMLLLELNQGARRYRCKIDPSTGEAALMYIDVESSEPREHVLATAKTPLAGPGKYRMIFANVDDRLRLWVDEQLIEFNTNGDYEPPAVPAARDEDLTPVGIAGKRIDATISQLVVQRDIYYRSDRAVDNESDSDRPAERHEYNLGLETLAELVSRPAEWSREYNAHYEPAIFDPLGPDEFFMMGDNSPRSKDSRLWPNTRGAVHRFAVPRSAFVGKAFFIYWPHAVPFLNDGKGFGINLPIVDQFFYHQDRPGHVAEPLYPKATVPFYPQVTRMTRIR